MKKRLKFSREIKGIFKKNIWTERIPFYRVGYQRKHKHAAKPVKYMTSRQQSEGLYPLYTGKGSHTGSGGRIAHFIVAMSHNKGVIFCEQYFGKINGEMFADFKHKYFEEAFEKCNSPKDKLFLHDGDLSQNSRKANNAMYKVGVKKFSILARSPDNEPH